MPTLRASVTRMSPAGVTSASGSPGAPTTRPFASIQPCCGNRPGAGDSHPESSTGSVVRCAASNVVAARNAVTGALVGSFFAEYWWLPVGTVAAVAVGVYLFRLRQRTQASESFLPVLLYNFTHQHERKPGMSFFDVGRAHFGDEAGQGFLHGAAGMVLMLIALVIIMAFDALLAFVGRRVAARRPQPA